MKLVKKCGSVLLVMSLLLGLCLPMSAKQQTEYVQVKRAAFLEAAEASRPNYLAFSENGQTVYNQVLACLLNGDQSVFFKDHMVSPEELKQIVIHILRTHQEIFYFSGAYTYHYKEGSGQAFGFEPKYYTYDQPLSEVKKVFNREVSDILSKVSASWSDTEKALFLHDYIAVNYSYDSVGKNFDIYTLLTEKKGVCQAYTDLYQYLLKKVGVEAAAVQSDSMNHTWNIVKIGGKWYHVDITWDDPLSVNNQDYYGAVSHDFFLVSDQVMLENEHADWYGPVEDHVCDDSSYEQAYWKDSRSPVVACGEKWYYINKDGIYCADNPDSAVLPFSEKWSSADFYYAAAFSGLASFGGLLFYNTPSEICFFDPDSGNNQPLYTLPEDDLQIFGMTMKNGEVSYIAETEPGRFSEIHTLNISLPDMLGDINGDLAVNTKDAVFFGRMLAGWSGISCSEKAGDIDGDKQINVKDVVLLKRWLAKWNIPYKIGSFVF